MKKTLLAAGAVALMALASPALAQSSPNSNGGAASQASTTASPVMRTPTQTARTGQTSATPRRAVSARLYRAAQEKLKADNLYTGPIDGRRSDTTVQAIRAFQTQHHLNANGYLDRETRRALGV